MKYLPLLIVFMYLAPSALAQGKTKCTRPAVGLIVRSFSEVILEPNSATSVCPSEEVTLNCSVPDTHNRLLWTVPDAENDSTTLTIAIFCNNMNPSRRGPYQPALVGCADGRIASTLTFNVSRGEVNVTCWTDHTLMEYVTVGPQGMYQISPYCEHEYVHS